MLHVILVIVIPQGPDSTIPRAYGLTLGILVKIAPEIYKNFIRTLTAARNSKKEDYQPTSRSLMSIASTWLTERTIVPKKITDHFWSSKENWSKELCLHGKKGEQNKQSYNDLIRQLQTFKKFEKTKSTKTIHSVLRLSCLCFLFIQYFHFENIS